MSKSKRRRNRQPPARRQDEPQIDNKSLIAFMNSDDFDSCCRSRYIRLDHVPEIAGAIRRFAETVGSMTIHLMMNTDAGDVRIKNELSRTIDIEPYKCMNRSQFLEFITSEMLYTGNAVVRPKTTRGYLRGLQPIPRGRFFIKPSADGYDYTVVIDGTEYDHDEVLHFPYNPDPASPFVGLGLTVPLKDLAESIMAGSDLTKDFMTTKFYPSLIIKADSMTEKFQSSAGREEIENKFVAHARAGRPLIIPAEQIEIEQVKPFSLSEMAIDKTAELDLKRLASVLGIPVFFFGLGSFNKAEWNNFINTKIRTFAEYIGQEMTRKLIYSEDWFIRLNHLSLLDFDVAEKGQLLLAFGDRGYINGNEARKGIGMAPGDDEALNEYRILENYIPADMAGNQKKLTE